MHVSNPCSLEAMPSFARSEAKSRRKHPHAANVADGIDVHFRHSARHCIWPNDRTVIRSRFFGWLVSESSRIGAIEANLYDAKKARDNDDFCDVMDCEEAYEYELGAALCRSWDNVSWDLALRGPILWIRHAWVVEGFGPHHLLQSALRPVAHQISRRYSIIVMNGHVISAANSNISQAAAGTLSDFVRAFQLEPLPGQAGEEGWLWAPNSKGWSLLTPPDDRPRRSRKHLF